MAEDVRLQALTYVIKLYDELTAENGAPTLGTQNQPVDFILANPERRRAVTEWATSINIEEASTAPQRRLPYNQLYQQVHAFLETIMEATAAAGLTGTPQRFIAEMSANAASKPAAALVRLKDDRASGRP